MDEPFGAVDPITREALQDELLRLQARLGKTIVFVTHDFTEAVKLGDRIAVLGKGSRVLQYDMPAAIPAGPADPTVAGFVGADASLKQLSLTRIGDADLGDCPTVREDDTVETVRVALAGQPWVLVLDADRRPLRRVSAEQLAAAGSVQGAGSPMSSTLSLDATLQEGLEALLTDPDATAIVTRPGGEYAGLITIGTLVRHPAAQRGAHGSGVRATHGADRPDVPL